MPARIYATLILLLFTALPLQAQASDFSLYTGVWDYGVGGAIADDGELISLDSGNGGVHVNPQAQVLLRYDFRGGWWPDLSVGYNHLGASGKQSLATGSYQIGDIDVIAGNTALQAGINLNDFNLSLDWRLLDRPWLRLEAGLEGKYLGGHANIVAGTRISVLGLPIGSPLVEETTLSLNEPVPLAHLRAEARPWSWLRLELSGGYVFFEGDHVGELRAVADIHVWKPIFLTAGYQEQAYRVKDAPYIVDARIDGPTLGITVATP